MTSPQPDPPRRMRIPLTAAEGAFRTALTWLLWLVGALAVVGSVVGYLVAGLPGVWGALLGAGVTLVFSGSTTVAMLRTTNSDPVRMAAVVGSTWLVKIVVVVAALLVLRGMDFYSRPVFVTVLLLGVVGSLALDVWSVHRARVPYLEPGMPPSGAEQPPE